MVEMPSAPNILSNDSGEMPNSCFMAAAPMKSYVIIWEGFSAKTNEKIPITKSQAPNKFYMTGSSPANHENSTQSPSPLMGEGAGGGG